MQILDEARRVAAGMLGCRAGQVTRAGVRWTGPEGRELTLGEIASAVGGLEAELRFESDLVFGSGAYAAVVEIERETGALRVRRLVAVDDAGTIINPLLAEGQVLGGAVQGLGAALMEEAVYGADGQPLSASFVAYSLPGAAEVPPLATEFVQTPSPHNPLGAKGIGEGGAIGTPAAIANAVADALARVGAVRRIHPSPPRSCGERWRRRGSGRATGRRRYGRLSRSPAPPLAHRGRAPCCAPTSPRARGAGSRRPCSTASRRSPDPRPGSG